MRVRPPTQLSRLPHARRHLPLVPVTVALDRLVEQAAPAQVVGRPLQDALGRVLAEDITAPTAIPLWPLALREGWAVEAAATIGASPYSPVVSPLPLRQVGPGDRLWPGTDAILALDAAVALARGAEITESIGPGEGARRAGEDAAAGVRLRAAGERLRPVDLAVAGAAGIAACKLRVARFCILDAGGGNPAATLLLAAMAQGAGADVEHREGSGADVLPAACADPAMHLVAVVGGAGELEQTADTLAASGEVVAQRLALRPGEAILCGRIRDVPVVLVPGRTEEALAAALVVIRPCLDRLMAAAAPRPPLVGPLTRKLTSTVGITEVALLKVAAEGLEPLAVADLSLAAIARAEAWLAIPAEREGYPAGEVVQAAVL